MNAMGTVLPGSTAHRAVLTGDVLTLRCKGCAPLDWMCCYS